MNRNRILASMLAAVISAGIFSAAPADVFAKIDMQDLPEPLSADLRAADVLKFRRTKPKLITGKNENSYDLGRRHTRYLGWEPVDNALMYYVYAKPKSRKEYELIEKTLDTSTYVEYYEDTLYKVRAVSYTYGDELVLGPYSSAVRYKLPDERSKTPKPYQTADNIMYNDEYEVYEEICDEEVSYASAPVPSPQMTNTSGIIPITGNTEEYGHSEESGFKSAVSDPLSTFSADVDTASYTNIRRMINSGSTVPSDAVRIEEMLNYFDYDYPEPTGSAPFSVCTEVSDCPWNSTAKLMMIGVQGKDIPESETPDSNLVFLVDVSGSMRSPDKLELAAEAINTLTSTMSENDRISIVTYSGQERVVLAGARGNQTNTVSALTECLTASGSTNGESGINAAYRIAEKYYIEGGNNRIILATDGDLNVGISSEEALAELISEKRESGVYFSVLGFGEGNLKDNKMEALADNGNGSYHYIDTASEAAKVLTDERNSTLYTIAEDVKFQVEFNPKQVSKYRLIGYDNRRLNNEDFADDTKDAGEIGAGHRVTALYEIIPADSKSSSELKYTGTSKAADSGEWANIKIRWKDPGAEKSLQITTPVSGKAYSKKMSGRMEFACAVTEFGLILQNSKYKGSASMENVLKLLENVSEEDVYKSEFKALAEKTAPEYTVQTSMAKILPQDIVSVTAEKSLTRKEISEWKKWISALNLCAPTKYEYRGSINSEFDDMKCYTYEIEPKDAEEYSYIYYYYSGSAGYIRCDFPDSDLIYRVDNPSKAVY